MLCFPLTKLRQILTTSAPQGASRAFASALQFNFTQRYCEISSFALAGDAIMNGKVIVVTGASGALGKVVAEVALARGARVAGIDHAPSQIPATPDRIEFGGVDLSDSGQAKKAIDAAAAHFGRLHALINIAGGFAFEAIAEGDPKTWQRMYALNVLTALNASQSAIPHLEASGAGRIVNIGAMGALQAGAGMGAYAASKAGVHRLTEALAAEWKGRITVNAVLPSTIDTAANRASMPKADFKKWVTAEELAEVILFLASDAASAVTGALLPVSGRV
jgi:NAD(P)-dependent dehydrogenase (short-subunit alcohol dehydrogenase family)